MLFRYVGEAGPESHFLGVVELEATNANAIASSLKKLLASKNLDASKMVALATDGAAVMRGCRNGVASQ